ncbi:MAG: ABC transporter ATP-binding protein [Desulfobacterales bacterium]|nr:ABC transporter ATP-binding protein [Desulfobacterales bacterium]
MTTALIRLSDIEKVYPMEAETVTALKGVNLRIDPGEFTAIMGSSGSGKSTLMHIAGLLDNLSRGRYELEGRDVSSLTQNQMAQIRNQRIGFIFQSFNLLPRCSAFENVALPMLYRRPPASHLREKVTSCLAMVGMTDRADHLPRQLSGGQQQRVAIARALVNDPALILADEPTGNLDTTTGTEIIRLLGSLNDKGMTLILVTHDPEVGRTARRRIILRDGRIEREQRA